MCARKGHIIKNGMIDSDCCSNTIVVAKGMCGCIGQNIAIPTQLAPPYDIKECCSEMQKDNKCTCMPVGGQLLVGADASACCSNISLRFAGTDRCGCIPAGE